jgi:hypothetical protein
LKQRLVLFEVALRERSCLVWQRSGTRCWLALALLVLLVPVVIVAGRASWAITMLVRGVENGRPRS